MSRVPEDQMLAYLLGDMSEAEVAAFENRIQKDPELRSAVRELESVLAAAALEGLEGVPSGSALWENINARIQPDQSLSRRPSGYAGFLNNRLWLAPGLAAVFLLGVSVWLISMGLRMEQRLQPDVRIVAVDDVAVDEHDAESLGLAEQHRGRQLQLESMVVSDFSEWSMEDIPALLTRIRRMEDEIRSRDLIIAARDNRISELEQVKERMVEEHAFLAGSYHQLDQQFAELYDSGPGLARFTVIELVDARSFTRGDNRRGLAEVARQFLMSPSGVLVGVPDQEVYYFAGEDDSRMDWGADTPMVAGGFRADEAPSVDDLGWEFETVSGEYARFESVSGMDTPLAFTVWSDDDQKGFLDVYNLPDIPSGQVAQLWLRGAGSESYLSVGVLPPLERGTGSLFYAVDEIEFTPREVLITVESGSGSNVPSGRVLLRGP